MSRHPYTNADDFVRQLGPINGGGVVLSRADAGLIIEGIAPALGMTHEALATKLSEAYQNQTEADHERHAQRLIRALGYA